MDHLNQRPVPVSLVARPVSPPLAGRGQYTAYPSGFESFDQDDSDSGLLEYLRILRRHKGAIFLASLAGLIIGFAIGIPMKPVYRATTSLEVLHLNEDFMNMKLASPTTSNGANDDISEEQTQAKLLQSTALLNRVIAKLTPGAIHPAKPRIATSGWRVLLHLPEPVETTPREQLVLQASKSLKVRPTAKTRVLEATLDSPDPQLATDFANTLSQEFIALNMEARWATTQRTGDWLRRELDEARDKLRQSEDALQTYASNSGLIFTDETTNVATEKLQQVQQNLSTATADRIAKQSRYELAQNAAPDSLADVLSDPALRETQSKINDLKRQIADLSAVFNPEYSKVRRLQAELDSLQPAFDRQRADILTRIKNDFTEASRRENLLATAYASQAHEVTGQDERAIQYNILKRDVDSNRQLYDTMLQQMKQASIASAMRASNVRVVDAAEFPSYPVFPNFKLNAALGCAAGLFLSAFTVIIREHVDRTLQQPGDIKRWTDLPELGTIPTASLAARRSLDYRPPGKLSSAGGSSFTGSKNRVNAEPVELVTSQNQPSLIAESFHSALTSILFVGENGSRPKVLVFTSANPADGKTTIVSNVAIAAADIRLRVLVIDADLRRPRMHQLFKLNNDHGLSDLLESDAENVDTAGMIKQTGIPGLHVITAGPPTNTAAHLLYSPYFTSLLVRLRQEYDMILIDTPPMLPMTDARVAGRFSDAVVLVARSNRTTRDALLAAKDRFEADGIRVLGALLNDWNPKRNPGGYESYHGGKYGNAGYDRARPNG